jgi:hypothetical protein
MSAWQPIKTAPQDRTIIGRLSGVRFLCAWYGKPDNGAWYVKNTTDHGDPAYDSDGDMVTIEPEEWCEVP